MSTPPPRLLTIDAVLGPGCEVCLPDLGNPGLVCENHPDRPWEGVSSAPSACGCGAGMPCPACGRKG